MSPKGGIIRQHHLSSGFTIMGDMGIGHHKIFFTHLGHTTAKLRSPVNGDKLTYDCAASDLDIGLFSFKLHRLRYRSDSGILKNMTFRPNMNERLNDHMGADHRLRTDKCISFDNCVRADLYIGIQFGLGVNDCGGVYHEFSPMEAISSASATRFSLTNASPNILTTLDLNLIIFN